MLTSRPRGTAAIALSLLALSACSSGATASAKPHPNGDTSSRAFHGCDQVQCTGTLEGAAYKIEMPKTWNGTLLLWSHGYRTAVPSPPDFSAVDTAADDAPTAATATQLLAQGYALAGSAYASNGWAVQDGVKA